MEELSGRVSRKPLGGADEKEGKVVAKGVGQKKVVAAKIVEKANPGNKGGFFENGGRDSIGER